MNFRVKEILFFDVVSYYIHLDWFVLSTEFNTHTTLVKGWLLDHIRRNRTGCGEKDIGHSLISVAIESAKRECMDGNFVLIVLLRQKPRP